MWSPHHAGLKSLPEAPFSERITADGMTGKGHKNVNGRGAGRTLPLTARERGTNLRGLAKPWGIAVRSACAEGLHTVQAAGPGDRWSG